jgi:glycosyltransferase involved in cell wall biosynthesis
MTSRWEGLPILPMEAMRAGVPLVATRVAGMGEVIEDGVSGLLVDSRRPEDIAQAVRRVSEDGQLRQRIVEAGRRRVRELFSEDQMIRAVEDVYNSVISDSNARV